MVVSGRLFETDETREREQVGEDDKDKEGEEEEEKDGQASAAWWHRPCDQSDWSGIKLLTLKRRPRDLSNGSYWK